MSISLKNRPAQYKQTSRKGKKAWRKNIELEGIERAIETNIEKEISHGTQSIESLPAGALFEVDLRGDEVLKNKLIKRKQIKAVKSKEILEAIYSNSKVMPIVHAKASAAEKRNKVQGVSKHELRKLLALAGKGIGNQKLKARVAKDGLVKGEYFDIWKENAKSKTPAGFEVDITNKKIPKDLLQKSTTGWSVATTVPKTLRRAPLKVKNFEKTPHPGKSYNPDKEQWKDLINCEYEEERVKENRRIQMEEYKKKIQHLMATLDDNLEESTTDSEDHNSEVETGYTSEDSRLSVNPVSKCKKKTKYQRNKQRRHEARVKVEQKLKSLKSQLHDLERLHEIQEEVDAELVLKANRVNKTKEEKVTKNHKLGTKHSPIEGTLEVKLSDELSDSLRKLRAEGNLLYDNFNKLQSSGRIEARVPITKSRRYKQKITEKWTYKDFK